MHSPGMNPGAKSKPFMTILKESGQILLFGGSIERGPISDVWIYDLYIEVVKYIQ
jgi:hypothetical protein